MAVICGKNLHLRSCRSSCLTLILRCFATDNKLDKVKTLTNCPPSAILDQAKLLSGLHRADQFKHAMLEFKARDKYMRGHMRFISLTLSRMEDFGLQANLMTYNRVLDMFPKGRYNNKTLLDAVWPKPHPQIDLALKVLTRMEEWGVRPDNVTYTILVEIFGRDSPPVDKCKRIAYWFDRFESSDPYEVKGSLPDRLEDLGMLILSRIAPVHTEIKVHKVGSWGLSGCMSVPHASLLYFLLHIQAHYKRCVATDGTLCRMTLLVLPAYGLIAMHSLTLLYMHNAQLLSITHAG